MATSSAMGPQRDAVDRRRFLSGAWRRVDRPSNVGNDIATIHIQARPDRLGDIEHRLREIGARSIRQNSSARLQVDIGLSEAVDLAAVLDTITAVPGVLAATLAGAGFPETAA